MNWKHLISNKDGTPSTTKIAFWTGFIVATLKLIFSDMHFGSYSIPVFSAADWGMMVGTLSGLYIFRQKDVQKAE